MARIVRGQTLVAAPKEFVEAARAIGVSTLAHHRARHIVPNLLGVGRGLRHPDRAGGDPDRELPVASSAWACRSR